MAIDEDDVYEKAVEVVDEFSSWTLTQGMSPGEAAEVMETFIEHAKTVYNTLMREAGLS